MNRTEADTSRMRSQMPGAMAAVPNRGCTGGREGKAVQRPVGLAAPVAGRLPAPAADLRPAAVLTGCEPVGKARL